MTTQWNKIQNNRDWHWYFGTISTTSHHGIRRAHLEERKKLEICKWTKKGQTACIIYTPQMIVNCSRLWLAAWIDSYWLVKHWIVYWLWRSQGAKSCGFAILSTDCQVFSMWWVVEDRFSTEEGDREYCGVEIYIEKCLYYVMFSAKMYVLLIRALRLIYIRANAKARFLVDLCRCSILTHT